MNHDAHHDTYKIAILLHDLEPGGMQAVCLSLTQAFSQYRQFHPNLTVELVLCQKTGTYLPQVPAEVAVVNLAQPFGLRLKYVYALAQALARYLKSAQPDVIIANLPFLNLAVLLAKKIARSSTQTILVEHTLLIDEWYAKQKPTNISKTFPTGLLFMMRLLYPSANAVVAPSHGIAQAMAKTLGLSTSTSTSTSTLAPKLQVIANPVVSAELMQKALEPLTHPWFQAGQPPVFVTVGRLSLQKDYATLLQAFAQLRQPARLIILGDGEQRADLETLAQTLGISHCVALPGFVANPYPYMRHASAFVLSSVWEVLPTVLIEALACGCPVIATNCNYGPNEILGQGEYGVLVPVQDPAALAQAMSEHLIAPHGDTLARQRHGQSFGVENAIAAYLALMKLPPMPTPQQVS
jgi:glycosyltransferase involved in cell wall biosynthesis